jgi:hypothetical protein
VVRSAAGTCLWTKFIACHYSDLRATRTMRGLCEQVASSSQIPDNRRECGAQFLSIEWDMSAQRQDNQK